MRQLLDSGGLYDRQGHFFKRVQGLQLLTAATLPPLGGGGGCWSGGGSGRWQRHFFPMCVQGAEPCLVHAGEQLLLPCLGPLASVARRIAEAGLTLTLTVTLALKLNPNPIPNPNAGSPRQG